MRLLIFVAAGALAWAQQGSLSGPVEGWYFDASERALRPVIGIPGAAYLGPSMITDLDAGSVAPNGKRAVVVRRGTLWLGALEQQWTWTSLGGPLAVSRIAWDRASAAVAIQSADSQTIALWRSIDDQAERSAIAEIPPGEITALAVEAGGKAVLAALPDGIYRLDSEGARQVAAVSGASALVLDPSGDLYAADRGRGEIVRIRHYVEPAGVELVAGGFEELGAMALAAGGRSLLVGSAQKLLTMDLATASVTAERAVPVTPALLEPLGDNGLIALNSRARAGDVLHVLDLRANSGVWFIPAGRLTFPAALF
jgi:hypothetical protein